MDNAELRALRVRVREIRDAQEAVRDLAADLHEDVRGSILIAGLGMERAMRGMEDTNRTLSRVESFLRRAEHLDLESPKEP